ncbi:MAG: NAD(P)H-hydrate dehydratase [Ruminococcus sp.]|nr:NAD(P)H-hydrate dehydratase [Ruminococcus sp.]
MTVTDKRIVKKILPQRPACANKYSVGSLLCVCGSYSFAGAAVLCARAALRTGAGLVRVAVPRSIYPIVSSCVPEAVFLVLPENEQGCISSEAIEEIIKSANKSDAVVMGCGSKLCRDTEELVLSLVCECKTPLLLDADGINALSKHINVLKDRVYPLVLTPHEGEMSRLTSLASEHIRENRQEIAKSFADEYGVTLLLKGKGTIIASKNSEGYMNPTGNAGMAVAGSGDVLSGMIGALMAQGADATLSAVAGAFLHGLAGDIAKEELTEYSLIPSDIIEYIPKAIKECIDSE